MKMTQIDNKILLVVKRLLIILAGVYLVIGIGSNVYSPSGSGKSLLLVPLVFIGPLFFKLGYSYLKNISTNKLKIILSVVFITMVFVQIYVLTAMPATVYHDPFRVLQQAEQLGRGGSDWTATTYFLRNPNNVPITALLGQWFKLTNLVGLNPNTALSLLNLGIFDGMVATLLTFLAQVQEDLSLAVMGALFFLLTPYSYTYNIQVFYTDTPIFLAAALTILLLGKWHKAKNSSRKRKCLLLGALFLVCILAQIIKPNFLIFGLAAFFVMLLFFFFKKESFKQIFPPLLTVILAIIIAFPASQVLDIAVHYQPQRSYQLPLTHWTAMGLNTETYGEFSAKDRQKILKVPTFEGRQKVLQKTIKNRAHDLGFLGLSKLWLEKSGILLSLNNYNEAYTGGFIDSPPWFQRHQRWWQVIGDLMLRCAFIFLYAQTLLALVSEFKRKKSTAPVLFLLLVINGYLTAHVLFWEVEERYGQAILPLLFAVIGLNLKSEEATFFAKIKNFPWRQAGTLLATWALVGGSYLFAAKNNYQKKPLVTVAQRSQLSQQYGAKVIWLQAGGTVTQNFSVKSANNYFSYLKVPGSQLAVSLTNLNRQESYQLVSDQLKFSQNKLSAGKYRLRLYNMTKEPQPIWLVETHRYRLGQAAAEISQSLKGKGTLVYLFGQIGEPS